MDPSASASPQPSKLSGGSSFRILRAAGSILPVILIYALAVAAAAPLRMPQPVLDTAALTLLGFPADSLCTRSALDIRVCVISDTPQTITVFRNGTQYRSLDSVASAAVLVACPALLRPTLPVTSSATAARTPEASVGLRSSRSTDTLFFHALRDPSFDRSAKRALFLKQGAWRSGITLSNSFDAVQGDRFYYADRISCLGLGKIGPVYVGGGFSGGWITGYWADEMGRDTLNHFRNRSWSFTVGLPFLRYEVRQAGWLIPEYFTLGKSLQQDLQGSDNDSVGRYFRWEEAHRHNLSHEFLFRFGHVRAQLLFDRDLYIKPVVQVGLRELPAFFGTWGLSLTGAADMLLPGVEADVKRIDRLAIPLRRIAVPIAFDPLHLQFHFRDLQRYDIGLSTSIHLAYRKHEE